MIYDTPKLSKALRDHAHFTLQQAEGRRTTWQYLTGYSMRLWRL
jgi:hypothetical protein